jgi:GTP-binding protein
MTEFEENHPRYAAIVALVGRPNVGKSTLFNRITRTRKAIVDPAPGVTRDRHYERVSWNDRHFMLIDTGGIETDRGSDMGDIIRAQTLQAIDEADIILFLLDAREGLTPADHDVADLLRKTAKPFYYVVNKIDGPELETTLLPQFYALGAERLWPVAAEHGYGVRDLLDTLAGAVREPETVPVSGVDTINIAFFGRPNVGKSSLINRLTGSERMLVSDIPGTTRDAVDIVLSRKDRTYTLIDTAGIRRRGKVREKLEKFSIIRALAALERCDLALLLIDAGEGITEQDTKVIGYTQDSGRACILVVNKWDLVSGDRKRQKSVLSEVEMATPFVGFAPVLTVSALTGAGVNRIFPAVEAVYSQYQRQFPTNRLNLLLQSAVAAHPPPMYGGRRLKLYYTTQIGIKPPTFVIIANYPKGVHFSYHRYLTNQFRKELGLDKSPVRIVMRERKRKKYS